jgi:Tfp pilus assembly protein PilN
MRAVNLLPEQQRRGGTTRLLTTTSVLAAGAVLLVGLLAAGGILFVQGRGTVSDKRSTLAGLQHRANTLEAAQLKTVPRQPAIDRARVDAFTSAAGARMKWDNLLDDISRVLPAGSWLTDMNVQAPGATAAAGSTPSASTPPTAFTVSGYAFTQDIVAKVMDRLELVPALSDVTLQSSTTADVGARKAYQFTMSANVLAPEVSQ